MTLRTIHVLRMGHRLVRDDRTTTHVCLVARAFGAEKIYVFNGDPQIKNIIDDVNKRWGGDFRVNIIDDWISILSDWKSKGGIIVHLTMYGLELGSCINEIDESGRDILLIIGAGKVPRELYEKSDFNVAVGNQPHSEVAALAVFLDNFFRGEELKRMYYHANYRIVPSAKEKKVEKIG